MKRFPWLFAAICATGLVFAGAAFARDKKPDEYPNATRQDPKVDMSATDQRKLNKATDLVNENKGAEAEPVIQDVIDSKRSSKYAQAFAHQLMAQVYWDQDKGAQAIEEY
jgi:hypothetical protein